MANETFKGRQQQRTMRLSTSHMFLA